MHFEILVEDESGKALLNHVVPKILGPHGEPHTWRTTACRGIGHLPKGMKPRTDAKHRALLNRLPAMLRGFGRSLDPRHQAVVIVVDNDRRDCRNFLGELKEMLAACNPAPRTLFRLAIAEMEAWLLGDPNAVARAYPKMKPGVLDRYRQDSLTGTWEVLADAIHRGGAAALKKQPYPVIGTAKHEWADRIGRYVGIDDNRSPSFAKFRDGLLLLAESK